MATDYLAAALWLRDGSFDTDAALMACRDVPWSVASFGGETRFGYPWSDILDELEQLASMASRRASVQEGDLDDAWQELSRHVDAIERAAAEHLDGLDPAAEFTPEIAAAHAEVFIVLLALELFLERDTVYEVDPGRVVAFGAVEQGAPTDRYTIHILRALLSLDAFIPVLRSGGAYPPATWRLAVRSAAGE